MNHIHTPDDGRGLRDVFVNGKLVMQVFYANTRTGVVKKYREPLKLNKWRKRVLTETLHGDVRVEMRAEA